MDKIYADVAEILQMADVKEKFAAGGGEVGGMKPAEFTAQIKREADKLSSIVVASRRQAGVIRPPHAARYD